MKQGTVLNKIVIALFFGAILLYLGGAAWRSFHVPYPTVQAFPEQVDDTVEVTGFLAREETVLSGSGGIVDLIPSEGEKVGAGGLVAILYDDQEAVERTARLETLRREAAHLEEAIEAADRPGEQSGETVVDAMVELRSAVESGDLTQLERRTLNYKGAVLQQALRQGSAGDLTAGLERIREEIGSLESQSAQDVGRIDAPRSGIFSGLVDGYEAILTPESLETLHPSDLDRLADESSAGSTEGLCKLITNSRWYFVCAMTEVEAARIHESDVITVRFSRDWSGEVKMRVDRIGDPENGRVAVIFSSDRFLSDTTLLRRQTVELVFSSARGLRVPTEAVRMNEEGVSGVYVRVSAKAEFKPVNVLAQGEDYYLVEPRLPEVADEKTKKKALRSGDAVIVAREEIWDGKVVE